jgi:hypothetical protein
MPTIIRRDIVKLIDQHSIVSSPFGVEMRRPH